MLERFTTWSDPLTLVCHLLPSLPAADGSVRAHYTTARVLCSVAEHVVLRVASQPGGPLSCPALAEASAGTDELGRLLLAQLPFDAAAAPQAWPPVQAYPLAAGTIISQAP